MLQFHLNNKSYIRMEDNYSQNNISSMEYIAKY